jgi:single-strand DNA-binding protein
MNDTQITLIGNVVDEPRLRVTKSGHSVANFRLASTSRRKDHDTGQWVDSGTLWVNVTCWRAMAENVVAAVHRGQPVLVTGRYYSREYKIDEVVRVAYELEATAVGHDLSRGVSDFRKTIRPFLPAQVELDSDGIPADRAEVWLGASEVAGAAGNPEAARELATVS